MAVPPLPDLTTLSHAQKDALILALWEQVGSLTARLTALEQKLNEPAKTPDNSSVPPSKGQKPNRSDTSKPAGPRRGSLGRRGGGRSLMEEPDQVVSAKAAGCRHCGAALGEADHHLHSRYDKIELPRVSPPPASRVGAGIAPLRLSQNRTCGSRIGLLGSIYQNASDSWADACGGFRSFHKALSDAIRPLNQAGA